jgi:hypothetical protein
MAPESEGGVIPGGWLGVGMAGLGTRAETSGMCFRAASRLGVNERTFRRWVAWGSRIPAAVGELVRVWVARAAT